MSVDKVINNCIVSLKKIGISNPNIKLDEKEKILYVYFHIDDLINLINKTVKKNVKKVNPNLNVATTLHKNYIFIIIKGVAINE